VTNKLNDCRSSSSSVRLSSASDGLSLATSSPMSFGSEQSRAVALVEVVSMENERERNGTSSCVGGRGG
jgi:hypothetical protein